MTKKRSSEIFTLKMDIFPEIGPRKNFVVPPNSAPGLRPCSHFCVWLRVRVCMFVCMRMCVLICVSCMHAYGCLYVCCDVFVASPQRLRACVHRDVEAHIHVALLLLNKAIICIC